MNFIATGVKELTRRLRRQKNRLALSNARKFVDKAEIALGRHGWRHLADDESVHSAYEALLGMDGVVKALHDRIAEIETAIREQEAGREQARREHQEALERIDAERRPLQETLQMLQNRLAENTKALPEQKAKRAALQGEQTALLKEEKRARRRLISEDEKARLQQGFEERRTSLAEQATQLTLAHSALADPITAARQGIKETKNALHDLDVRVQQAGADLAARERVITLAIAERNKEIAATRRQITRTEDEKNASYLAAGHRIAELAALPSRDEELFASSQKHRQHYERLTQLESTWLHESRNANRQDLRIFNFVAVTVAVLLAITLLLIFRTPGKRDWLPSNTQANLSVDVRSFTDADFTRALQSQEPEAWQNVWSGLIRAVAQVPQIDVRRQVSRITRAFAPAVNGHGPPVDYLLVEMRPSVDVKALVVEKLWSKAGGFGHVYDVGGLPIYERSNPEVAIAQIGPSTLALGSPASVETLIQVRLGLKSDLKSDAQFFSEFQRLDDDNSAFRLVTYQPKELTYLTDPLLNAQLLGDCQALGLTLDMHDPVSAVFLLNTSSQAAAISVAKRLEANPDQVLQLKSSGPNLFIERPTVSTPRDTQVEWRFRMTAPAAREFLQRVSRLGLVTSQGEVVAEK